VSDDPVNLFAQQAANRRRSKWLVIWFVLFFLWLGFGADAIQYWMAKSAHPDRPAHFSPVFGIILAVIAMFFAWSAWKNGPRRVLAATNAREVIDPQTPEEKQLVNVVEEMAVASGIPRPRIWIVPDPDPNAFATGHDEQGANVAVTQGLLTTLSRDELQAVIGHEMGHIKNLDVRLMTLLAALVGAIALVAQGSMRMGIMPGGSSGSRDRSDSKSDNSGLGLILMVLWVVSWILAPIIVRALALGVSRDREYLADAMSAQFTRNPASLASALQKIDAASEPTRAIPSGTAHLCIADPLGRSVNDREGFLSNVFGTHPPIAMRIARLKAMAYQEMKRTGTFVPPDAATA
jgi:heat shock protein HtpX